MSDNALSTLPSFKALTALRVISIRHNNLAQLDVTVFPPHLEQLILTDNILTTLPLLLSSLPLRKIMVTRNRLEHLPDDFGRQTQLELVRLSHNGLVGLPLGFWTLPRLAWVALAGNPILGRTDRHQAIDSTIPFDEVQIKQQIGEGTSGMVYVGVYKQAQVAIKMFKQSSSDGAYMVRLDLQDWFFHFLM
jgi:hypothetical protein